MIKFVIAARRKPTDTQEFFFYNWSIIHVALMLTTPIVFQTFRRYVQHYSINGISNDLLWHPLSPMAWDSYADHWLNGFDDLVRNVKDPGYRTRMQPHVFADPAALIEFNHGYTVFERPDFVSGGVKLVHFLKKRTSLTQQEFEQRWRNEHGPAVVKALEPLGILRKYVQSPKLTFDASAFTGTFFETANFGQYAGIEEFWFGNVTDLRMLAAERSVMARIRQSDERLVADEGTFSMVTTERVVYDDTAPGNESPKPAVLRPGSLEAQIDAQGYEHWNDPNRTSRGKA
jgi:hypothetical protein